MVDRQWCVYPELPDLSYKIAAQLSVSPVVGQLLLNRNIRSLVQARQFLDPTCTANSQFDKDVLTGIVDLLKRCRDHKRKVMIYGDYDVDGMTSTAMMVQFLRSAGVPVSMFIPHRFEDGYGLNIRVLPRLIDEQISVLITLDCGISNKVEIEQIKSAGVMVVVMDHHTLPHDLPAADFMINPQFFEKTHVLSPLCTAGIVYKFIEFASPLLEGLAPETFLDLAAMGTIADVAGLWGENRRIVREGLGALSRRYRPGVAALLDVAEFGAGGVGVRDVGFTLGPRLNAAGRLGHAQLGVDVLLADDYTQALTFAKQLQRLNESRQALGTEILSDALQMISDDVPPVLVLSSYVWHAGIIGIIASRLVDRYGRPVVLIAVQDGLGRGSARTSGQVNVYKLLAECRSFFKTFGGHAEAAGFSILPENIEGFSKALVEVARQQIGQDDLVAHMDVDMRLSPEQLGLDLVSDLDMLGPFGKGNPMPMFYTQGLTVLDAKVVGNGQHLKLTFTDQKGGRVIDGIGFGLASQREMVFLPKVEFAFHLQRNIWGGRELPQLHVVDFKAYESE